MCGENKKRNYRAMKGKMKVTKLVCAMRALIVPIFNHNDKVKNFGSIQGGMRLSGFYVIIR
jgi:hypothetical protein